MIRKDKDKTDISTTACKAENECAEQSYVNNTKLARYMPLWKNQFETIQKVQTMPRKNSDICTTVELSYDSVFIPDDVSQFDRMVMDAIYTYLINKQKMDFTPQDIVKQMTGLSRRPSEKEALTEKVKNSITKLSYIKISIDCTTEFRAKKIIGGNDSASYTGYLLPVEELKIRCSNGVVINGYHLLKVPSLYQYAENVKQIITFPQSLLSAGRVTNETVETMLIRRLLITKIEATKNKRNHFTQKIIRYGPYRAKDGKTKGFVVELGIDAAHYSNWKKKRNTIHKTVVSILKGFISERYIQGFSVNKEGRSIVGVSITIK